MLGTLFLIGANLVPLLGVLFWGWDAFELLVLYWLETAVIAFWTVVQIGLKPDSANALMKPAMRRARGGLGRAVFFSVHTGIFMTVHLLLLWEVFGGAWSERIHGPVDFVRQLIIDNGLWIPLAFLFVVRGGLMLGQVFGLSAPAGERGALHDLYGRIITLHMTLMFGAFAANFLGGRYASVILIAIKTLIDVFYDPFRKRKGREDPVSNASPSP